MKQDRIQLPERMTDTLREYRKRVWLIKFAEGVLAAVFGLVISYLVVFVLDRFGDTSRSLRIGILLVGSLGFAVLLPLKLHRWIWKQRTLSQVARLLGHVFPRFSDHLLGVIELAAHYSAEPSRLTAHQEESPRSEMQSPALVRAAIAQVDEELEKRDLSQAVPNPRHRIFGWAAGVPLAACVLGLLLVPEASRNAFLRWLTPWRDVERYTFVQLDTVDREVVVPYAEPFEVETRLRETSPWKPEAGTARFGPQAPVTVERVAGSYRFALPPQTEQLGLSIRVGDAREDVEVMPKPRPALTELTAHKTLPAYLQRPEVETVDAMTGIVRSVRGSSIQFRGAVTRGLSEFSFDGVIQESNGVRFMIDSVLVDSDTEHEMMWTDIHELSPSVPHRISVEAVEDRPPVVAISKFESNRIVLANEVVDFIVDVTDDYGVRQVGIEWQAADGSDEQDGARGEKLIAAGSPLAEELSLTATFSAERERVAPQAIRMRAFAVDYTPDRERSYSNHFLIHILSPEEHFEWITNQMVQWANAAKEVYDAELRLNEANRELMGLPPQSLDDPAARRKIQEQATAERANAASLEALVTSGKGLVKEAMRNEEFDPQQLNDWAEMLAMLEDLSGKKMPSVAQLLQQATEAQGQGDALPQASSTSNAQANPGRTENDSNSVSRGAAMNRPSPASAAPPTLGAQSPEAAAGDEGETPEDPNQPGGGAGSDRSQQAEGGSPGNVPANPTPSVGDTESGFNESQQGPANAPQAKGGLGLPTTILKADAQPSEQFEQKSKSASELVIKAVEEQNELLEAFAIIADELNDIMLGLENSTFVKRLKAASRKQMELAVDLDELGGFGVSTSDLEPDPVEERSVIAKREEVESNVVLMIQEDMDAYAERKPNTRFQTVLRQMRESMVVDQLRAVGALVKENAVGQSTIDAEYWSDSLDRWAEELVEPLEGKPPELEGVKETPSLSPEIVLEVLRIIDREMKLREETRELHQARDAITKDELLVRGQELSDVQARLAAKARELVERIEALPDSDDKAIIDQQNKLEQSSVVMDEVTERLGPGTSATATQDPAQTTTVDTGPSTLAAISEVIEILLETARAPNNPMVSKSSEAQKSALMLIGIGDDAGQSTIEERAPVQGTGKAGRVLPEEYRYGLDLYLNALEGR